MSVMAKIGALYGRLSIQPHYSSAERVDQRIAKMRALGYSHQPSKEAADISYHYGTIANCPMVTLSSKAQRADAASVFFLHGGAYLFEPLSLHWSFVTDLVRRTGRTVHFFLYPKAPEHDFRSIQSQTLQAYQKLCEIEHTPPIVLGDSAGAGLSLRLMQMLRDAGGSLPQDMILLSPWLDCVSTDPKARDIERKDPMLRIAGLRHAGRLYGQSVDPADPEVSPLFGRLDGLPRAHIFTSDRDILMPDAVQLTEKLKALGASPHLHAEPRLYHDWMFTPVPEARGVKTYIYDLLGRS